MAEKLNCSSSDGHIFLNEKVKRNIFKFLFTFSDRRVYNKPIHRVAGSNLTVVSHLLVPSNSQFWNEQPRNLMNKIIRE